MPESCCACMNGELFLVFRGVSGLIPTGISCTWPEALFLSRARGASPEEVMAMFACASIGNWANYDLILEESAKTLETILDTSK